VSRSGIPLPGTPDESKIQTLKFFVFKSDNNTLEQYKSITINADYTSSDPMWNATTRSLRILVIPGPKRIYCVANWAATPTAEMPAITDLTVTDTATLLAATRVHTGVTPQNPPVMSGRLTKNIVGNELDLTMTLSRQVAMVNIYPMIASLPNSLGAEITIEGVKFMRLAGKSYIFEQKPVANPANSTWDQTAFEGVHSAPVTALTSATAVKYPVSYYIPENIATSASAATYMIVKALYNGVPTYYTVVLNGPNAPHTAPYAVERNHSYDYYLTIQGLGAATATLFPSKGNNNDPGFINIQSKLEVR
jgi:hypothetical protein